MEEIIVTITQLGSGNKTDFFCRHLPDDTGLSQVNNAANQDSEKTLNEWEVLQQLPGGS